MSTMTQTRISRPVSPRQRKLITDLWSERNTGGLDMPDLDALTSTHASTLISTLLRQPRKAIAVPEPTSTDPVVPDGRYAVLVPGDGALAFFTVDNPTTGRWAGRTFVNQMASDTEYPVRGARRAVVLGLIAEDYMAAGVRFGQEIGRCCRCGRTLTNEGSREAGIGPECAGKF